jgi:hypothetical protein
MEAMLIDPEIVAGMAAEAYLHPENIDILL